MGETFRIIAFLSFSDIRQVLYINIYSNIPHTVCMHSVRAVPVNIITRCRLILCPLS